MRWWCAVWLSAARFSSYRLLRCVKNRYGPSGEIGVYSMAQNGVMLPVANPSAAFLRDWGMTPEDGEDEEEATVVDGSAVLAALEGGYSIQHVQWLRRPCVLRAPLVGPPVSAWGCAGSKPILVEVQSLVTMSRPYGGRRAAEGVSLQRLNILLAVLEKRLGYSFVTREVR